jgi:ABC-2 type transport system permease protein
MSPPRPAPAAFSSGRVAALIMRYLYLLRGSWLRLMEIVYWPAVQMITWGFLQTYLAQTSSNAALAAGTFIGAILLWDILFRGQLGFSISFLEEMWSRNIGNLLMSPLRPVEFVAALTAMSLVRLAIGLVPVAGLALAYFGFNLFSFGIALPLFFANLILTSWSIGLVVSGLILRFGMAAEGMAWTLMFLMMPLACVYYPVATLPGYIQWIAWLMPPTYVFEGMRALLIENTLRLDLMGQAFLLNALYFAAGMFVFLRLLYEARKAGTLLQMGE